MDQLKSQVRNSFTKIRHALDLREKLLLRQLDVLNRSPDNNKIDFGEVTFQTDAEEATLELLRNYGSYQNIDLYLQQECRRLENENESEDNEMLFEKSFYGPTSIDNKKLSESIINLTLKESQNLITKSKEMVSNVSEKLKVDPAPSNDGAKSIKPKSEAKVTKQTQPDDSKLKRNVETTSSKKKTLKNISNLTLNNCGGSIVLKNISNLTINTCKQATTPKAEPTTTKPATCSSSKSCDGTFYERLISENEVLKRSIVNQSLCSGMYPDPIATTCMSPPASVVGGKKTNEDLDDGTYSINSVAEDTTTNSSIMEEAEDGLPPNRHEKALSFDPAIEEITTRAMMVDGSHTPIIQCWLNTMLGETEGENQNFTEFLEISSII